MVHSIPHLYILVNNESLSQLLVKLHGFLLLHHNESNCEEYEFNEKDLAQGACNVFDRATISSEKNFLSISNIYEQIRCFIERVNAGCRVKGPANGSKRVRSQDEASYRTFLGWEEGPGTLKGEEIDDSISYSSKNGIEKQKVIEVGHE